MVEFGGEIPLLPDVLLSFAWKVDFLHKNCLESTDFVLVSKKIVCISLLAVFFLIVYNL